MGTTIVIRNGSTLPSQGSGITLAEPAFNTNLRTFHIGLGHGTTAEWIGAPISGASGTIASAEAYKIPTAKAVKDYVTDYVTAVNGVLTVNGFAGGVTLTAGTGMSVAAVNGTLTLTNVGVQSFNGATGAVQGVSSVQGRTGAIGICGGVGIAIPNAPSGNTLSVSLNYISGGTAMSARKTITKDDWLAFQDNSGLNPMYRAQVSNLSYLFLGSLTNRFDSGSSGTFLRISSALDDTNKVATDEYITVGNLFTAYGDYVTSFNGRTGAVQGVSAAVAGTGISVSAATGAVTITNTGVQSFNGLTGSVQGVSAAVAGTGISVSGATGAVTITNTGVQSFNGNTGAVTGASLGANTFSGVNSFTVGISAAGITTGALHVRAAGSTRFLEFIPGTNNQIIARGNSTLNLVQESHQSIYIGDFDAANNATYVEVDDANQVIKFYFNGDYYTFPIVSGTVGQVLGIDSGNTLGWRSSVSSFNGATGTVGISAGSGISITQSGTTFTIASTASGGSKTYAVFTPLDNQPPASNFATLDTRNSIAVLDFDASTDESAVFVGVIPEGASLGSGLKIRISWMATSATSGACRWGVQIERMNTDEDSDSFDTAATGGSTTNGTSGIVTTTEITVTTIDSVAAGEPFRLKVFRDADGTSGTDDMTGDAELVAVEVRSAS